MTKFKKFILIALIITTNSAMAANKGWAPVIGAVTGGAVGNQVCANQKTGVRVACTIAGTMMGEQVGEAVDQNQQRQAIQSRPVYQDNYSPMQNYQQPRVQSSNFRDQPQPAMCTEVAQQMYTPNNQRIQVISCACQGHDGNYRQAPTNMCGAN